jgi:hypothetical protein
VSLVKIIHGRNLRTVLVVIAGGYGGIVLFRDVSEKFLKKYM